jgi:UDP-glucose 4-epimerase
LLSTPNGPTKCIVPHSFSWRRGWKTFPSIDRVYVNERARQEFGWRPRYDFRYVLDRLRAGDDPRSPLSRAVESKGYLPASSQKGPYPVE